MAGPGDEPDFGAQAEAMAAIRDILREQEAMLGRVKRHCGFFMYDAWRAEPPAHAPFQSPFT